MLAKMKQRLRRGKPYHGIAVWSDDYTLVPRPGFYAVSGSGPQARLLAKVPLVCVDDAPDDATDGSCHFEYAGPRDYPQRKATGEDVRRGNVVGMEVDAVGQGGLNVG